MDVLVLLLQLLDNEVAFGKESHGHHASAGTPHRHFQPPRCRHYYIEDPPLEIAIAIDDDYGGGGGHRRVGGGVGSGFGFGGGTSPAVRILFFAPILLILDL